MNVLEKPTTRTGDPVTVDTDSYKSAMRRLASGVTIVTTVSEGVDHAMTASAFTSVSLRPPLVLVCVERAARLHAAILDSGLWGVSILPATGRRAADHFAHRGRPLIGQLDDFGVRRGATGVALLDDALAQLECRTTATYDGGDHTIVVGAVLSAVSLEPDSLESGGTGPEPETASAEPLVHYAGGYYSATNAPAEE